jgi:glycine/D-amino acid oxidase-like deaminating enzyme
LAVSGFGSLDPTPQQLRWATHFLPMFARRWRNLRPGSLQGWRAGHETLASWRLDETTPMERMRVLDPKPTKWIVEATRARAAELLPDLAALPIQAAWGGYIDSTPDGVPVIGEIPSLPGFVLAAGFSGHGFGIAPGAGRLVADLVTGAAPAVETAQYRPERFAGSAWGKVADF